jgi:cell wall-associated NlpC family hydrolase
MSAPSRVTAWAAGKTLVGVRFRLQGRDAATGLDCVGVIVAAYAAAGVRLAAIDDYALRGFELGRAEAAMAAAGLERVGGAVVPGCSRCPRGSCILRCWRRVD